MKGVCFSGDCWPNWAEGTIPTAPASQVFSNAAATAVALILDRGWAAMSAVELLLDDTDAEKSLGRGAAVGAGIRGCPCDQICAVLQNDIEGAGGIFGDDNRVGRGGGEGRVGAGDADGDKRANPSSI